MCKYPSGEKRGPSMPIAQCERSIADGGIKPHERSGPTGAEVWKAVGATLAIASAFYLAGKNEGVRSFLVVPESARNSNLSGYCSGPAISPLDGLILSLVMWAAILVLFHVVLNLKDGARKYSFSHALLTSALTLATAPCLDWSIFPDRYWLLNVQSNPYWVLILTSSSGYFIADLMSDIFISKSSLFIFHHIVAFLGLSICSISTRQSGGVWVLCFAELGGVTYNLSRLVPKTKAWRLMFLVTYTLSRVPMLMAALVEVDLCLLRDVDSHFCIPCAAGVGIIYANTKFIHTQIAKFRQMCSDQKGV